jgi:hypothetical protein
LAWRGVEGDDALAFFEAENAFANFLDDSGELVAEERGRNDHASVVAALIHLKVGTAGKSDLDLDQHLAFFNARDGYALDF